MCSTDNSLTASQPVDESAGPKVLLPLIGVVFMLSLVIGLAMPVLPLYVHNDLGFDTFIVGWLWAVSLLISSACYCDNPASFLFFQMNQENDNKILRHYLKSCR